MRYGYGVDDRLSPTLQGYLLVAQAVEIVAHCDIVSCYETGAL